jgi:phosphoribosylformylglycinamidine cyclo-ligase
VFELIASRGGVVPAEMWEVFNMGCGFCAMVPADRASDAVALLARRHPGAAVIGKLTGEAGRVRIPGLGLEGGVGGLVDGR